MITDEEFRKLKINEMSSMYVALKKEMEFAKSEIDRLNIRMDAIARAIK